MPTPNRREFVAGAAGLAAAAAQPAAQGFVLDELVALRDTAAAFMRKHSVPGLSVAFARNGRLVLEEGYGYADVDARERVRTAHQFRIASVTKPFTSAAIFHLAELQRLRLQDRAFGTSGLLRIDVAGCPEQSRLQAVTVEHLLTHTCGGWQNDGSDPMFRHTSMDHAQLIDWTLHNQALDHDPGTHYAYSNFGYCLLGRLIEALSGKSYAAYVQDSILSRCGIRHMAIAGNTRADRRPAEVVYYQPGGDPYDMQVTRMDSHGGWIATASDLLRFAVRVDGFSTVPDILTPGTIRVMTTGTSSNPGYAKGWAVNSSNNWWHNGSLAGTTSILVRTSGGMCWSALANTRNAGMDGDMDRLMWDMVGKISVWPYGVPL